MIKWLIVLLGSCASLVATAAGMEDLQTFLKNTTSIAGTFDQKVVTEKGEDASGAAQGTFRFLRPGCFSWHYDAPFEELMMSDGKSLWLYDVEMAQVTVKTLSGSLPATPASILFGNNDFTKDFVVKELPDREGMHWLSAIPKDSNSPFSEVQIAFKNQLLTQMILKDNFGQHTVLTFSNLKKNLTLKKTDFQFKIPKGVDVLQDQSGF